MFSFGFNTQEADTNARCCQKSWSYPPLIQPFSPSCFWLSAGGFWLDNYLLYGFVSGTVWSGGEKALLSTQHHPFISLSCIPSLALSSKFPAEDIYFPSILSIFQLLFLLTANCPTQAQQDLHIMEILVFMREKTQHKYQGNVSRRHLESKGGNMLIYWLVNNRKNPFFSVL